MISLVFVSRDQIEQCFRTIEWYKKLLSITRSVVPVWIEMDIHVIFVDEPYMRRINREYHHQDRVTDVLSFFYPKEMGSKNEGELFLCIPQLKRQAKRHHTPWSHEYARTVIHGFLHLQGYDHLKAQERKHMTMLTSHIFSFIQKTTYVRGFSSDT